MRTFRLVKPYEIPLIESQPKNDETVEMLTAYGWDVVPTMQLKFDTTYRTKRPDVDDTLCPFCKTILEINDSLFGYYRTCDKCNLVSLDDEPFTDRKTLSARRETHEIFDLLWKEGYMDRGDAYKWLQLRCGWASELHIRNMTLEQCNLTHTVAAEFLRELQH